MNDEQLNQLIPGFIISAAISIYSANYPNITEEEAAEKAEKLIKSMDLKKLFNNVGV